MDPRLPVRTVMAHFRKVAGGGSGDGVIEHFDLGGWAAETFEQATVLRVTPMDGTITRRTACTALATLESLSSTWP